MADGPDDPELAAIAAVLADEDERGEGAARTLATLVGNLMQAPGNPKFRRVRVTNAKIQQQLLGVPGGEDFLRALGFVPSAWATGEHAAGAFLEISEELAQRVRDERGAAGAGGDGARRCSWPRSPPLQRKPSTKVVSSMAPSRHRRLDPQNASPRSPT